MPPIDEYQPIVITDHVQYCFALGLRDHLAFPMNWPEIIATIKNRVPEATTTHIMEYILQMRDETDKEIRRYELENGINQ